MHALTNDKRATPTKTETLTLVTKMGKERERDDFSKGRERETVITLPIQIRKSQTENHRGEPVVTHVKIGVIL